MNINKIRNVKWFALSGAVLNIVISAILIFGYVNFISPTFQLYYYYETLINLAAITIMFSLLLISLSFRIDQLFVRLKWVSILPSIFTLVSMAILIYLNVNAPDISQIVLHPIMYVLIAIAVILMSFDLIRLTIKYKNNPFYHNGKHHQRQQAYYREPSKTDDGYINPSQRTEDKVVDEKDVIDPNLSYFEIYEKRSEELKEVEDLFDEGKIDNQEYERRRKAIYAKYDRYN